jgi:hypothetical protein
MVWEKEVEEEEKEMISFKYLTHSPKYFFLSIFGKLPQYLLLRFMEIILSPQGMRLESVISSII